MSEKQANRFKLVTATRATASSFMSQTALGKCAKTFLQAGYPFDLSVATENREALSVIYNRAIDASNAEDDVIVFLHDDVYITDLNWPENLTEALNNFDVVGVVGRKLSSISNIADATVQNYGLSVETDERFSGRIATGANFIDAKISVFGDAKVRCDILDGVFIAATRRTLINSKLRFDERFHFHFYDVDFCRQAQLKSLILGTWPISLQHESTGNFNSPEWHSQHQIYLSKYGEDLPP
jgi:GT2 family glycosyltransferase